jgi:hypothetical protein
LQQPVRTPEKRRANLGAVLSRVRRFLAITPLALATLAIAAGASAAPAPSAAPRESAPEIAAIPLVDVPQRAEQAALALNKTASLLPHTAEIIRSSGWCRGGAAPASNLLGERSRAAIARLTDAAADWTHARAARS